MEAGIKNPTQAMGDEKRWRHFVRRREGSTAIEFAVLIMPFALLVFAILESCISFAAQQVMTTATDNVARQYRTGQIRPDELSMSDLKDRVCEGMSVMVGLRCKENLEVDLQTFATFAAAAAERTPYLDGDLNAADFVAAPGGAGTKNMLRVYYKWPVMTDLLRLSMSNINGGKILHYASVTWQNEPYAE